MSTPAPTSKTPTLRVFVELPEGLRLVSIQVLPSDHWAVCIATPRLRGGDGRELRHSAYYGMGQSRDLQAALEEALRDIEWKQQYIAPKRSDTSLDLNLDDLEIKL